MFAKAFMIVATFMVQTNSADVAETKVIKKTPVAIAKKAPAKPVPAPVTPVTKPAPEPAPAPAITPVVPAQPKVALAPTKAEQIVIKVQAFYNQTKMFKAKFRQYYKNAAFEEDGKKGAKDGLLYVKKPGKMRWDYQGKSKKLRNSFITDGTTAWMVDYENKQYGRQKLQDATESVALSFLLGKGNLLNDFSAELENSGKYGGKGDLVIKLTPKRPSANYKRLYLAIDKSNYRVKRSTVIEANNNTNEFRFYEPNFGADIQDKYFFVNENHLKKQRYSLMNKKTSTKKKGKSGK